MVNLIPQIAQILGVEIGEKFKVKGYNELTYRFDADGLKESFSNRPKEEWTFANAALGSLLAGKLEIIKLPWKPKKGDAYYTFEVFRGKWVVIRSTWWTGAPCNYALLDKGWVFRTKEEAEDALTKVAAEMGVEYEI
mgnify:CR=1 FL=1